MQIHEQFESKFKLEVGGRERDGVFLILPFFPEVDRLSQSVSPTRLAPPSLSIPDKRFELSRQVLEGKELKKHWFGFLFTLSQKDKKLRAEILLEELLHVLIYADTK